MLLKSNNEELSKINKREIAVNSFFLKDRTLLELFKRSLPPKEAYFYFPKGDEIIILNEKKPEKSLRRIYINVSYTEKENEWLSKFKSLIASHLENRIPDYWNDGLNLSYIYSTERKLDKAYTKMIDYFKWYSENFPMNIQPEDKIIKLLNTGFTYVFGRDHQFRPIIICQPYILQKCLNEHSHTDTVNASIFICQYMSNYMLIPGQIENWIMFLNLENTSILTLPDSLKKLIKALSDYFIAKLYKSYILGMNVFIRVLYKFVCNFLEEVTVKKVVILENRKDSQLFRDINPQNLEERFGGKAQNCIYDEDNCLFPPRMPSDKYFKDNENPKDILINEEEYIERYNSGNIPKESVCPCLIDKIKNERKRKEKEEIIRKRREEVMLKRKEKKTKAELNINTNWNSEIEFFYFDKFKICSNGFLEEIKNFRNIKDKFCNDVITLNILPENENNFD